MFRQVMVDNITRLKVQEFFERQTPEAGAQLGDLRQEVPKSCPGLREEYKRDVPYYRAKKSPAYLNVRKGAVEAGFFTPQFRQRSRTAACALGTSSPAGPGVITRCK